MASYQGHAAMKHAPQNYAEAREALGGRESIKIGHNTRLEARGADVVVILHHTAIVRFRSDGSIVLDTGGWNTVTTRGRMDEFIRTRCLHVYSDARKGGPCLRNWDTGEVTPFPDGESITLPPL